MLAGIRRWPRALAANAGCGGSQEMSFALGNLELLLAWGGHLGNNGAGLLPDSGAGRTGRHRDSQLQVRLFRIKMSRGKL